MVNNSLKKLHNVTDYLLKNLHIFNNKYEWVHKSGAGYEKEFCELIGWVFVNKRHWDCTFNGHKIELKKSKSNGVQVDEIRYSEEILCINEECKEDIITIFIEVYSDKSKYSGVKNIFLIENKYLYKLLDLENKEQYCRTIIERNQNHIGLSFTHRIKYNDLRQYGICIKIK